jgi:hypothetical protein
MAIIELNTLVPNDPTAADDNAAALVSVLAPGARIHIPAVVINGVYGVYHFSELDFGGGVHSLPPNVEIFGDGPDRTYIKYEPTNEALPLFDLAPGFSGSVIHDLQLIGPQPPGLGVPSRCMAIRMQPSRHNIVRDVWFYYFETAILHEGNFSGYSVIEQFMITGCTHGIKLHEASNAVLISAGRIVSAVKLTGSDPNGTAFPLKAETGAGIDIQGTNGSSGPGGGSGIVLSQVTIEDSHVCLRIVNSHDIVAIGCYFEPGYAKILVDGVLVPMPNTLEVPRKTLEIDAGSERISILGSVQSESDLFPPGDPFATQNWTPHYNFQAPEARGTIDTDAFRRTGTTYTNNAYGAATSGATAAHANHLRNGDMSRGATFWTAVGTLGVSTSQLAAHYVIGGRSLLLRSSATSTDHVFQDFVIDSGVRTITAIVRYRNLEASDKAAFRIDLATVDGLDVTTLGFYSDTDANSTDWRVRALTARFEGTPGGVQGPRTFRVRLYPYNVDGPGEALRTVIVDSVWVVEGEYAAPYRPYQEGIELLSGSDRTVMFSGPGVSANFGPAPIPGTVLVPRNAVGMVVEMSLKSTDASNTLTVLRVDDNTGGPEVHELVAMLSDRPTTTELTLPLIPGATPGPQWSLTGASSLNLVTYSVVLKGWIYRL